MHLKSQRFNRREFLATGAAALAGPTIVPRSIFGATAPSERIQVGVVGLGSRGFNLVDALLAADDAEIVAICDVDTLHYRDKPWGQGKQYGLHAARDYIRERQNLQTDLFETQDFREICDRNEIDAVVIATPDHWHALATLEALRNGKDVYCEKPITHTFHEGQRVYREVAKQGAVFQTGSQQRSDAQFRHAVELVRNGHLGRIERIEIGLPPGYEEAQNDTKITDPPGHLDYDFWCGPAPMLPYMRARHHRWWRGHRAFGGGVLMDWIGHHNDIVHWALDKDDSGPLCVESIHWTEPNTKVYNTPHHYEIQCEYEGDIQTSISSRHEQGARFFGEEGWVHVRRGRLEASDPRWTQKDFTIGAKKVYVSNNHMQNFLDCMKSRQACICPPETAHRSITPGHLGYVSQELGRALAWNPESETVIDDPQANELLQANKYREPWG